MAKIFVYGTLMYGYRNYNKYLKGHIKSFKNAYTIGKLYHLNDKQCPAITKSNNKVYSQVMTIKDDEADSVIESLDNLEKFFEGSTEIMYQRVIRDVFYNDGTSDKLGVYIFINEKYLKNNETIHIENGNWHDFINLNYK